MSRPGDGRSGGERWCRVRDGGTIRGIFAARDRHPALRFSEQPNFRPGTSRLWHMVLPYRSSTIARRNQQRLLRKAELWRMMVRSIKPPAGHQAVSARDKLPSFPPLPPSCSSSSSSQPLCHESIFSIQRILPLPLPRNQRVVIDPVVKTFSNLLNS